MAVAPLLAIATVAGIGLSLAATAVNTSAQINAANYRAEIADRNAKLMLQNADRTIARSQQEQEMRDRATAFMLGRQEAVQSASGLSLGGGSFMLTRKSSRELGRLDALNVRQAGELEAYNYRVQSEDSTAAAGANRSSANSSLLEGFLTGASTLIGGAGRAYSGGSFGGGGNSLAGGSMIAGGALG